MSLQELRAELQKITDADIKDHVRLIQELAKRATHSITMLCSVIGPSPVIGVCYTHALGNVHENYDFASGLRAKSLQRRARPQQPTRTC